ncbi:insulinase family protein [Candidatus Peregrinibacteria bacterium]|nr:MAG: insulinase family protein [Candidatus Peregrinibacteria bacterium]
MFSQKKFSNGLRLVTAPVEGTKSVTVLILVGAGSRYESDKERGIAHFLEHMFFKGGKKYDTPKKVSETIDGIGGDFNAFTGKEYAGYYVKCSGEQVETAFDVLSDMLISTKLSAEDIERERGVILEELNMYQDTPMYQVGWDFEHILFGDTPMGRDQIGLPETIQSFSADDFRAFRHDLYSADNTVVIAAGDITPEKAEALTKSFFTFDERKKSRQFDAIPKKQEVERVHVREKKTEQAHLVIGYPSVPLGNPQEYATRLLAVILGGNMSSRMFLAVREEKGLCYSIHTSADQYSDTGVISTHAGVDLRRVPEAIAAISEEYRRIAEEGIDEAELAKAKSFLKGKLTLRMEDSEERASFFGVQAILRGDVFPLEELFQKIESVSLRDIQKIAKELLVPEKCHLSLIGPFSGREEEFLQIIS